MIRQTVNCELCLHEGLLDIFPLMNTKEDRLQGRYGNRSPEEVSHLEFKAECGFMIKRNLEMINWMGAADSMPGPLDPVIDTWEDEELSRQLPQPIESPTYSKIMRGLGQASETPGCLTSGRSCNEQCPCVRDTISRPQGSEEVTTHILMSKVTDDTEFEIWNAAIVEENPGVAYAVLSALASTESIYDHGHGGLANRVGVTCKGCIQDHGFGDGRS